MRSRFRIATQCRHCCYFLLLVEEGGHHLLERAVEAPDRIRRAVLQPARSTCSQHTRSMLTKTHSDLAINSANDYEYQYTTAAMLTRTRRTLAEHRALTLRRGAPDQPAEGRGPVAGLRRRGLVRAADVAVVVVVAPLWPVGRVGHLRPALARRGLRKPVVPATQQASSSRVGLLNERFLLIRSVS